MKPRDPSGHSTGGKQPRRRATEPQSPTLVAPVNTELTCDPRHSTIKKCAQDGQGGIGPQETQGCTDFDSKDKPTPAALKECTQEGQGGLGPQETQDPGSHRTDQRRMNSPWIPDGMHPGRQGRLWPPGIPGLHQHQRVEQGEDGRPNGVHPGGPRWPWPPGDPGLHQAGWGGLNAPGLSRVHPGWPGWPRPPGDPGSHRVDQGGWAAPYPLAEHPRWLVWSRSLKPRPRLFEQELRRCEDSQG